MINLSMHLQMNVAERLEKAVRHYLIGTLLITLLWLGGRILLDFLLRKSDPLTRG